MKPIDQIKKHLDEGENFLLKGGAGSGKTYSLMEVLDYLYSKNLKTSIACITFTKVAVAEIRKRAPYRSLWVSTIHEFLWDSIKTHQKELKNCLVELIQKENDVEKTGIKYKGILEISEESLSQMQITYKEWLKLEEGVISHDEVLKLANRMFEKYPLLCKIVQDKFHYILVDEFQDTEKQVIDIFLKYFKSSPTTKSVIGFFGDSMQAIYTKGVGSLEEYIQEEGLKEVLKPDNWRCSKTVIGLINEIRNDEITQEAAGDNHEGKITFLYSKTQADISVIKSHSSFQDWDFSQDTKELYLTHNLISNKAGFDDLLQIYDKDRIIEHVRKIVKILKENPSDEAKVLGKTFGEVLNLNLKSPSGLFSSFVSERPELFEYAKNLPFENLRKTYLSKDQLIEGGSEKKEDRGEKKDEINKHLTRIQRCLVLYNKNKIQEFRELTEFSIESIDDKKKIKELMDNLQGIEKKTIGEVIDLADQNCIVKKDEKFNEFIKEKPYIYNRVKNVEFEQFQKLNKFEEGHSPYSTQHGVKGAEFENVFVILDNGKWNDYNFSHLFKETVDKESVIERTRKMFYVSCSRAKNNLVVYFHNPSDAVLMKAKEWFGEENVIQFS